MLVRVGGCWLLQPSHAQCPWTLSWVQCFMLSVVICCKMLLLYSQCSAIVGAPVILDRLP